MSKPLRVSGVRFIAASGEEITRGLLGYITCVLEDAVRIDGLTLHRTGDGRLVLSFPARRDAAGRKHFLIRPLTDATRRDLERQVFRELELDEGAAQ